MNLEVLDERCNECNFEVFCYSLRGEDYAQEVLKNKKCKEVKLAFEEKLPLFLRNVYKNYINYYYYFNKIPLYIEQDKVDYGEPVIVRLSRVNYEFGLELVNHMQRIPWLLVYTDCSPSKNIDGLIVLGQLFGRRKAMIYVPEEFLFSDLDYNFFILNQAGLPVILEVRDESVEDKHFSLCEKWLQQGQIDFYPYSSYFKNYFFRLCRFPYSGFVIEPMVDHFVFYNYKDRVDLLTKFLVFFYNTVDIESLLDQLKKAYFSSFRRNNESSDIGKESEINVKYLDINLSSFVTNFGEKVNLVKLNSYSDFSRLYTGYVYLDFTEKDYLNAVESELLLSKMTNSLFLSYELFLGIDNFNDFSNFYRFLYQFQGFPFSLVVKGDGVLRGDLPEPVFKLQKSVCLDSSLLSYADDILDLFFTDKKLYELPQVVEPYGTVFHMIMDKTIYCNFLNMFYGNELYKIDIVLRNKLSSILEG